MEISCTEAHASYSGEVYLRWKIGSYSVLAPKRKKKKKSQTQSALNLAYFRLILTKVEFTPRPCQSKVKFPGHTSNMIVDVFQVIECQNEGVRRHRRQTAKLVKTSVNTLVRRWMPNNTEVR